MRKVLVAIGGLTNVVLAQQARKEEDGPQVLVDACDEDGACESELGAFTLDASWRVQHNATKGGWQSCIIQDGMWDARLCPDPTTCAKRCAVDGMSLDDYDLHHGITELKNGVRINYVTATQYGVNVGARMYMLDDSYKKYKVFKLKNREFAFDIDISTLPCGVNAALYLVGMDADGQRGTKNNDAGAHLGTGYCDARCPHGENFVGGQANMDWGWGSCCPEMDLFEGNAKSSAFTAHTCESVDFVRCEKIDCGDSDKGHHYEGVCDKDGCDFNAYRMGDTDFFGEGKAVDTEKVFTVVTQFITEDGTDDGALKEIRRQYIQGGKVIQNAKSSLDGIEGDSLSEAYCTANKKVFEATRSTDNDKGKFDQFGAHGGIKKMGEALEKGMVVAVSLWDDPGSNMRWLDSIFPRKHPKAIGAKRGPCDPETGYKHTRRMHQRAYVKFTQMMYGPIGSTAKAKQGTRLRRRFEHIHVDTSKVVSTGRQSLAGMMLAGAASLALLAGAVVGSSRLRARWNRGASSACLSVEEPLAAGGEEAES